MTDREKIVNAFVLCRVNEGCSTNCPYWNGNASAKECTKKLAEDVYSLLKNQEAVEPEAVEPEMYYVGQDKYKFYRCPACKTAWYYKGNYCLGCGRKVKWK